jgi:hypothetical protein
MIVPKSSKSNVVPMRRTQPVDPKFLMMAAGMMKDEGKLKPNLVHEGAQGSPMPAGPNGASMPLPIPGASS